MARILYGIMGDARGHLSRSLSVVQHLPDHQLLFAGGGSVLELRQQGYDVHELPMLATLYKDTRVDFLATATNALKVLSGSRKVVNDLVKVVERFDPHLIITDYEYFVPLAAKRLGRPCISLDHQHILTLCHYKHPKGQGLNRLLTCLPISRLYSNATHYLVSSFFELPPLDPRRTEVLPPILRKYLWDLSPSQGDHVLVYTSGGAYAALLPHLEQLKRPCYIYGFGEERRQGNLHFKAYSVEGFLGDLASCRYVVSNGGHNLISEALFYDKPVVCLPIHFLYEQFMNGYFLKEFGFGEFSITLENFPEVLLRMEKNTEAHAKRIKQFNFWGNDQVVARLEAFLAAPPVLPAADEN